MKKLTEIIGTTLILGMAGCTAFDEAGESRIESKQKQIERVVQGVTDQTLAERKKRLPLLKDVKPVDFIKYIKSLMDGIKCYCPCDMVSLTECDRTGMYEGVGCSECVNEARMAYDMYRNGQNGKIIPNDVIIRVVDNHFKEIEGAKRSKQKLVKRVYKGPIDPALAERQKKVPLLKKVKQVDFIKYIKPLMDGIKCYCPCDMASLTECDRTGMYEGVGCGGCVNEARMAYDMYRNGKNGKIIPNREIIRVVNEYFKNEK